MNSQRRQGVDAIKRSYFQGSGAILGLLILLVQGCNEEQLTEPADITRQDAQQIVLSEILREDSSQVDWAYISTDRFPPDTLLFTAPDSVRTPDYPTWLVIVYRRWFTPRPVAQWILIHARTGDYQVLDQECLCLAEGGNHAPAPEFHCFLTPEQSSVDQSTERDTLALYATTDRIYGQDTLDLDTLQMAPQRLLTTADLTRYVWCTHTLQYPDSVYHHLASYTDLWRKGFVVTVDTTRMYYGVWQTYLDSWYSAHPVIILWPQRMDGAVQYIVDQSLTIYRSGLPRKPVRQDPRSDRRIFSTLQQWNLVIPYNCQ